MIDLRCTRSEVGGTAVLALDGVVDLAAVPRLHDELRRFVGDHPGRLVAVDIDAVGVLDDAALGLLLGAASTVREHGGDLVVVCHDARLLDRLAATRFDRAVPVRPSLTAAVSETLGASSYDQEMGEDRTP